MSLFTNTIAYIEKPSTGELLKFISKFIKTEVKVKVQMKRVHMSKDWEICKHIKSLQIGL